MSDLLRELRLALRGFRLRPGFAATVILTVALGVGVNTAIFSFVRGVLLRPLGYAEAGRLYALWEDRSARQGPPREWTGRAVMREWQQRNRTFSGLAAQVGQQVTLTEGDTPRPLPLARVTVAYFDVLGVAPVLGRGFLPDEAKPGAPLTVVLGQNLWRTQFHGDPAVVGKTLSLDGTAYTVVGVAAPGFRDPFSGSVEAWTVLPQDPSIQDWNNAYIRVVGRLAPGVDASGARADLGRVAREIAELQPTDYRAVGVALQPLREAVTDGARQPLLVLFSAVGMVLLLVCANVAGLLLARGGGRARELAVRVALGASRGVLVRQMLVECMALAVAGGALGVLLGGWSVTLLRAAAQGMGMPRVEDVRLDAGVLGFALGAAVLSGLIFGLLPALLQSGAPASRLRGGGRGIAGGGRARHGLVVSEVALALALLVGAGLLGRSLLAMTRVDPGFRAEGVLTGRLRMPSALIADDGRLRDTVDRVLAGLGREPGVVAAGAVSTLVMSGGDEDRTYVVEGRAVAPGEEPGAEFKVVTPGYFPTLGVQLLAGRLFNASDDPAAPRVALVNGELARTIFGQESPIGRRLRIGDVRNPEEPWWTIVGVVAPVHDQALDRAPAPEILLPFAQAPRRSMAIVVRTAGDPLALASALRSAVGGVDTRLAVGGVRPLVELVEGTLGVPRLLAGLVGCFAALALLLAVLGVYGVMAQAVGERRREFGVRLALGAAPADLLRLVLRQSARLALLGVAVGLLLAIALGLGMASLLFGVRPLDPVAWGAAGIALVVASLLAALAPARRAAGLEPAIALREE